MILENNYSTLYSAIGYIFKNKQLINQALIHRSKQKQHNERLEFLGDSILSFVIAEILYLKFPKKNEGELSLLRINLICGSTLTEIAQRFNLGAYISFGSGEIKAGGRHRSRLLEDAFEALIAAIYLDSNISVIKDCIISWYKNKLDLLHLNFPLKDPKSQLQEYLQSDIHMYPKYKLIHTEGVDHDKTFTVEVSLCKFNKTFQAQGKSRKEAERIAATSALNFLFNNKNIINNV